MGTNAPLDPPLAAVGAVADDLDGVLRVHDAVKHEAALALQKDWKSDTIRNAASVAENDSEVDFETLHEVSRFKR